MTPITQVTSEGKIQETHILELKYLTPLEEKLQRLDEALRKFMHKYHELVWLARTDEKELMKKEIYEGLAAIKRIEKEFPEDVKELYECDSNWQHGFNSGVLAFARYISTYIEDTWWPEEDTGGVEWPEEEIVIIEGKRYVKIDGKKDAEGLFPELDT